MLIAIGVAVVLVGIRRLRLLSVVLLFQWVAPPHGIFISDARAQSTVVEKSIVRIKPEQRAAARLSKKNTKFTLDELIDAVNDSKGNEQLKTLLGKPIRAERLMYRAATPFERQLIERFPDEPIAKLLDYVVLTYEDKAGRDRALIQLKKEIGFEAAVADEAVLTSAVPTEQTGSGNFLGATKTENTQWGMYALNFDKAWLKVRGNA